MSTDEHDESGKAAAQGPPADGAVEGADSASPNQTDEPAPEPDDEAPQERRRRPVLRRVLIGLGALTLVLALVAGGTAWYLVNRYAGNIERVADVFDEIDEETRPAPATPAKEASAEPVTFLLVGSDTRVSAEEGEDPGGRSDAIMLARFSGDREHAQLISIPRDSWVDIPGRGMSKINAAYALGGPSLLIQTVEQLTQVRVDHYLAIDFDGLVQVTDDLGGVEVVVAETTTNGPYTFPAGVNQLDGEEARWYLGQRYGLPGGDFDRVKRQQQYLRAMFGKLFASDTFTNPGKLDGALRAVTDAVSVDDTLSDTELVRLAFSLRDLRPENIEYFTAPVLGTGMEGAASVVYLDSSTGERMWEYLRNDSLAANADEFSDESLPAVPR